MARTIKRTSLQDLISNSPYCLLYSSCDISLKNLVLDQLIIPYSRFFLIHITCLLDIVRKNSRKCIIGGLRARTIPWFFGHFWKCSEVVEFWHVDTQKWPKNQGIILALSPPIVWLPLQIRKYSLSNHAFNCWLRITGMGLTVKWWEN